MLGISAACRADVLLPSLPRSSFRLRPLVGLALAADPPKKRIHPHESSRRLFLKCFYLFLISNFQFSSTVMPWLATLQLDSVREGGKENPESTIGRKKEGKKKKRPSTERTHQSAHIHTHALNGAFFFSSPRQPFSRVAKATNTYITAGHAKPCR